MVKIILNEKTINSLMENMEMTEHKFHVHIRRFISELLSDPVNAKPSELLEVNGLNRKSLLSLLERYGIVIRKNKKIIDKDYNGEPKKATMLVQFLCPKHNFDRNLEKLYIRLFETNEIKLNEEGECAALGGATSSDSSGQFIAPLSKPIKRQINKV